ncbi:hypothetical protein Ahy_B03g065877 isoform B [Arachis hypogaea]|uniref:Uncharacterized protein n=1 Tax=Arachis hypogaea TaxID=3818 RepID=A0A445A2J4_ARAHY|nr:hypothetical protein Ahy_B03g065877 isoform B [Arachis hypogaea]
MLSFNNSKIQLQQSTATTRELTWITGSQTATKKTSTTTRLTRGSRCIDVFCELSVADEVNVGQEHGTATTTR